MNQPEETKLLPCPLIEKIASNYSKRVRNCLLGSSQLNLSVNDIAAIATYFEDALQEIVRTPNEATKDLPSNLDIDVPVCDNKYRVIAEPLMKNFRALRNGEDWRSLTGDNLIYFLAVELQELRTITKDLLEDKARLDWLELHKEYNISSCGKGFSLFHNDDKYDIVDMPSLRTAISNAMKQEK